MSSQPLPLLLCFLCFLLSNTPSAQAIEPDYLWIAINSTLATERLERKQCTKIILYNQQVEEYAIGNFSGDDFIVINIEDGFINQDTLTKVQASIKQTIVKSINRRILHCILIVSIVNTSSETQQLEKSSLEEVQRRKFDYTLQMANLLQFKTPVNQRILILVRFGESQKDFGQCKKSIYQKYPRRLVPIWEQVLFDFFPYARAVHAVRTEKLVQTRREESNYLWMCDDIIEKILAEENCIANTTVVCKEKLDKGEFSAVNFNMSECTNFTPRM
jgi:hypothetical protein